MFFPYHKSKILVIGFQACNDAGPRYNYVRTLKTCKVNRLFIKDDFGPRHLGDYYLGENGTFSNADMSSASPFCSKLCANNSS